MSTPWQRPAGQSEVRLVGRLVTDPEPVGGCITLRISCGGRHRAVLVVGPGVQVCNGLRQGSFAYVVGFLAEDAVHEVREFLATFDMVERAEAKRLEREWRRDYERAVRRAAIKARR